MSRVLSLRLKDEQMERLARIGRKFGKKPSETAAQLLEEAMRHEELPYIDIRGTLAGREAFVGSSRLKVWHVAMLAQEGDSAASIAESLGFLEEQIIAALAYAAQYPEEIAAAIADNDAAFDRLFPDAHASSAKPVDAAAS